MGRLENNTHTHADTVCCTVPLILTIYGYYHVLHVRPSLTQAGRKLTSPQKTKQYVQGKPYSVCAYNTNREPTGCVQDYWICRKRKISLVKAKSNFVVLSSSLCFIVRDISKQIQLNGHKTIISSLCDWSSLRIIVSCNFFGCFSNWKKEKMWDILSISRTYHKIIHIQIFLWMQGPESCVVWREFSASEAVCRFGLLLL